MSSNNVKMNLLAAMSPGVLSDGVMGPEIPVMVAKSRNDP